MKFCKDTTYKKQNTILNKNKCVCKHFSAESYIGNVFVLFIVDIFETQKYKRGNRAYVLSIL